MLPTIDTAALPLVRITYPEMMTEEDVDEYAKRLGDLLATAHIGTVVDLRPINPTAAGAAGRRYLAAAIDGVTTKHPGRLVAEAIVMDSTILRGLYTAFCWIRSDGSYSSRPFADVPSAEAWVKAELDRQAERDG